MKIRINFAHRSSHTQLRQLADFPSLIVRLSFAHRSLLLYLFCILLNVIGKKKYHHLKMKKEGNETVTSCNALKLEAADGKMRLTDVADTKAKDYLEIEKWTD